MTRWLGLCIACVLVVVVPPLLADEPDPIRTKLDKAKAAFEADMKKLRAAVALTFDKREEIARKNGDKSLLDQIKAERRTFDEQGDFPASASATVTSKLNATRLRLEAVYKSAVREYTKTKQDDEASVVEQELAQFEKGVGVATAPRQAWNTPAFQGWMKATQALAAEKQIEAVSKKLMELNPGFDGRINDGYGKGEPRISDGMVADLMINVENVVDVSPLRAFSGVKSIRFAVKGTNVGKLTDLSPLAGMSVSGLRFNGIQVSDLSPLAGMPLTSLNCPQTPVSDLAPLEQCKHLKSLIVTGTQVTAAGVAALAKSLPNCKIEWDDPAKPKTPEPAASGSK
jgi:hypothetical protein